MELTSARYYAKEVASKILHILLLSEQIIVAKKEQHRYNVAAVALSTASRLQTTMSTAWTRVQVQFVGVRTHAPLVFGGGRLRRPKDKVPFFFGGGAVAAVSTSSEEESSES